jgi:dipeptidase D
LFTVEEETSLSGANAVLPNKFKSKHLINIDTENDKEIIIGSASTASYEITCPVVKTANKDQCYCLNVFGGVSGHSGASIHHTISNVIVDVSSILLTLLKKYQFNLVSINAGTAKNAIPSSIEVKFSTKENINEFKKSFTNLFQEYKNTYAIYEKNLDFSISKIKNIPQSFNKSSTFKVLNLICSIFNGMSQYDFDLKLTLSSSNIGVVKTENKAVIMSVLARSSFAFSDKLLQNRIESVVRLANASVKQAMYFPGAPAIKDNAVAKLIANVAKTKFKHHMEINAIHAGLEFGIISTKYPGLSYASIGPNITGEHTVKERMELKSFEFIYKLIRETIKNFN